MRLFGHLTLLLITGTTLFLTLRSHCWPLAVPSFLLHGVTVNFLGYTGAGHEFFHSSVFRSKALNQMCFRLCSIFTWNNWAYFALTHTKHHAITSLAEDPEVCRYRRLSVASVIPLVFFDGMKMLRTVRILLINTMGVIPGHAGIDLRGERKTPARRRLFRAARTVILVHALIVAVSIFTGHWPIVFVVTLAPFGATWFSHVLAAGQHVGLARDVKDYRRSTRTIILSPLLSFLYWNMNFHIEHHMYPGVPCYHLPKLQQEIGHDLPEPTLGLAALLDEL